MDHITASPPEDTSLEAWITKNIHAGRNEHVRSMLKSFLHKHKASPKTPGEIRKMLDKKIPETES